MATLGEIIAELDGGAALEGLIASLESLALSERLQAEAAAAGRPQADIATAAVRNFAQRADDEAWVKLLGRVQDAPSPAAACLKEMLTWALKP